MIEFDEARAIVLAQAKPLGIVRRRLEGLSGMVLAEAVQASFDLPRFDNSSVDGYGVCVSDLTTASADEPVTLELIATIQAGDASKVRLKPGQTVRIFTGAAVPDGVEAVVMQEDVEIAGQEIRFFESMEPGENIRKRGAEFQRGQTILSAGTRVTPPVVGLLATLGQASAKVYRKPKVGLITTGNEVVRPGGKLKPGQIYDANTSALTAALKETGIETVRTYYTRDEEKATRRVFEKALKENDVVISLGGVSVGAFDFVKDTAEALGVETLFWRIAIKPGKPVYFGKFRYKLVFGLPGNPVSTLVMYHQLVQPALEDMLGMASSQQTCLQATLSSALKRTPGRREFIRGRLQWEGNRFTVTPTVGQDSHMLGGLAAANCLIDCPADLENVSAGTSVTVIPLQWHFLFETAHASVDHPRPIDNQAIKGQATHALSHA